MAGGFSFDDKAFKKLTNDIVKEAARDEQKWMDDFARRHKPDPAELPHIRKLQRRSILKSEDVMDIAIDPVFRKYRILTRLRCLIEEMPRHLEMDDDGVLIIEIDDDMLTETARSDSARTAYAPRERFR